MFKKLIIINVICVFSNLALAATTPQQLNVEGFANCLADKLQSVNFIQAITHNILFPGDMLLPYLAVYSGKRLPVIGKFAQDRWSDNYAKEEESLALRFFDLATASVKLFPNVIYDEALNVCGKADAFCAGLISHNVLRTLGRSQTAVWTNPLTKQSFDFNPEWFKKNRNIWLGRAQKIQAAMISLHRDGSDDKWGDNYHFFGLFTFSLHEMALYSNVSTAWLVARMNQVLNPILAGGPEGPAKARIDRDSIDVMAKYLRKTYQPLAVNCNSESAYRLVDVK